MELYQFSPFGLASEETGLLALFANYSRAYSHAVTSLLCNGLFSLCDRDGESGWRREVSTCFSCIAEQNAIAHWSGTKTLELSRFLRPEEILETKRWMLTLSDSQLFEARFEDYPIFELCRGSIRARFGTDRPDLRNKHQEGVTKRLMVSSARMILAARRFLQEKRPELLLTAGTGDFIARCLVEEAKAVACPVATFQWDVHRRCVTVAHPRESRSFDCPLVFEDITEMRADSRTWPWELVSILDDLATFLGVGLGQLELPMAKLI